MQWAVGNKDLVLFVVDAATEADARISATNALNGSFWNLGMINMTPIKEEQDVHVEDLRGAEAPLYSDGGHQRGRHESGPPDERQAEAAEGSVCWGDTGDGVGSVSE